MVFQRKMDTEKYPNRGISSKIFLTKDLPIQNRIFLETRKSQRDKESNRFAIFHPKEQEQENHTSDSARASPNRHTDRHHANTRSEANHRAR